MTQAMPLRPPTADTYYRHHIFDNSLIQILILKSLSARDPSAKMKNLEEALAYAHLEGYKRVFLDESQTMRLLLAQGLAHTGPGSLHDYAVRLLSAFDAKFQHPAPQEKNPSDQ